jgi:hypothetical protein
VEVETPGPYACVVLTEFNLLETAMGGIQGGIRTQDNYECDSVGKRKHATEAIELWLDSRITVHVEIVCGNPKQSLRPRCILLSKP